MSNLDDEKTLELLEKAVYQAQDSLVQRQQFQPFLMLYTSCGKLEHYQNEVEDTQESYTLLESIIQERIQEEDIEIMILVVDTEIPDNISQEISTGIRIQLEEKSQKDKKIGARFLYVPYELYRVGEGNISVRLHMPVPVGLVAEYIR